MAKLTPEQWLKRDLNWWKKYDPQQDAVSYEKNKRRLLVDLADPKANIAGNSCWLDYCGNELKHIHLCHPHGNKRAVNWEEVRRGIAYEFWAARMCYAGYCQHLADGKDWDFIDIYGQIAGLVAFALYNDDEGVLADMVPRLTALADRSLPVWERYWKEYLFAPALTKLAGILKGTPVPPGIAARDCGVCDAPLKTRDDPRAFAEAMRDLADHYVMRMVDRANTLMMEFKTSIGRAIPYAFWAYMKLRPDCTSDHLLATWLGPPPKFTISDYSDELIEACRKRWPEI